jgi:hypothetical protein
MVHFFNLRFFLLLAFAPVAGLLQAQQNTVTALYRQINLPHAGDSIVKQQVGYVDPGIAGTNIVWDFRSVRPLTSTTICFIRRRMPTRYRLPGLAQHRLPLPGAGRLAVPYGLREQYDSDGVYQSRT